jgi:hypothetical protein
MTALRTRPASARRLLAVVRRVGAALAATALAALMAMGPPGTAARAASGDNYNQMTGIGTTASAITVKWTQGLLNAQNQPITTSSSTDGTPELSPNSDREAYAAGQPTSSPLSFMYGDFKNLSVTVSQTQNIGHQGITVKWQGATPTNLLTGPQSQFLQMMECYGDSSSGPDPEDCAYGSPSLINPNGGAGDRGGYFCSTSSPSTANPPGSIGDPDPGAGCDPYEPGPGSQPGSQTPSHCDAQAATQGAGCPQGLFYVPFVPANGSPIWGQTNLAQQFNEFDTNEVQDAITNSHGSGQAEFDALTNTEAPWLGCGALESNGHTRDCWLVIVPRGQYEPNGYSVHGTIVPNGYVNSSPVSASNWAQRIQIHLSYTPLGTACNPLTASSRLVEGSQVATRAMSSWVFPLNQAAHCNRIYIFTSTPETQTTHDLITAGTEVGMAFTTIPIGSEAAREGLPPPTLPKILYAPVAVTALDFGFNINERGTGAVTTPVNLTPRLLAKAVTQVYRNDLPDYVGINSVKFPGPPWSRGNPLNITKDPAFQRINSAVAQSADGWPLAPLLVGDRSSDNQRIWQWIQSDSKTTSWLNGTADPSDPVIADPEYVHFKLGKPPASDSFPQDYTGSITCLEYEGSASACDGKPDAELNSQYLLPVADGFDYAANTVLSAVDKASTGSSWNGQAIAPDGSDGWWSTVGYEPPGQLFMWALSDTPDTAAYGLIPGNLCGPSGTGCVGPSIESVTKALNSATTDSQGLLQVNPARVPAGGYPLVDVVYAAVPTNQSAAALNDYADLIQDAVGPGQTTGTAPGDLPPGYLPLPASLAVKARAVVRQLRAIANPTPTPTPTNSATQTQSPSPTRSSTPAQSASPANSPTSSTTPGPTSGASAAPTGTRGGIGASTSGSPSPTGPVIFPPTAQLAGGTTQATDVGSIRWALVAVLIIGAGGALAGTLLRSGRMPRWFSRWRP